jgi:Protein of unknown function (DUF4231)
VARKGSEGARLERNLGRLIDSMNLPDQQEQFLRSRWLDQVLWMERAASRARIRYYLLRLLTVLGAVVIPALVSLNLTGNAETAVKWTTFAISLLVAASAAIDGFFHFGMRWRHYRGTVEQLKSEGWSFAELSGRYHRRNAGHPQVFPDFVSRVEQILGQEVEGYVEGVVAEPQAKPQEE